MMRLSHRERVLLTLKHQEPDQVPIAIGGGPYGIVDPLYLKLVDYYRLGQPVTPFRTGHSISYMDDRLLEKLGSDMRYVYPRLLPNSPINPGSVPDTFTDSYGQIWHQAIPYYYAGKGILSDFKPGKDRLEDRLTLPNPSENRWMDGVEECAKHLKSATDYFITMRMVASHGVFQTACDLRGTENFLIDLAIYPEFAYELLNQLGDFLIGLTHQAMQAGGQYFDMIELPGDDYASNLNTLISPTMFRQFIKPNIQRMVDTIRNYRLDIYIMFHSDGLITSLLEDIIDLGVDVIHPLEPLPDTNFEEIKKQYGDKITFMGAIDISHALPGSKDDVIDEVILRIKQLAAGGGYILAPSNHIQADVPVENVVTMVEAARQYGKYPLSLPK